jgi:hypothetical protein
MIRKFSRCPPAARVGNNRLLIREWMKMEILLSGSLRAYCVASAHCSAQGSTVKPEISPKWSTCVTVSKIYMKLFFVLGLVANNGGFEICRRRSVINLH